MPQSPRVTLFDQYGNPLALSEQFELGVSGQGSTGFAPEPTSHLQGRRGPSVDPESQLGVRGPILTDEGSFRDDFSGSSLITNLTGTCTFANGSPVVTGVGTKFLSEVGRNRFLRLTGHANAYLVGVERVVSDEELALVSPYGGAAGSGVGVASFWVPTVAAGGGLLVSGSNLMLTPGLAVGETLVRCAGDYLPVVVQFGMSLSNPMVSQVLSFGLESADGQTFARLLMGGLLPLNQAVFRCSSDGGVSLDEETLDLSEWGTAQKLLRYQIGVRASRTDLSIEGHTIAIHHHHIPAPGVVLYPTLRISNATIVPYLGYLICGYVYFGNSNLLQIEVQHEGGAIRSQMMTVDDEGHVIRLVSDHEGALHVVLPLIQATDGGNHRLITHDPATARMLEAIHAELRLMNLHLSQVSDEDLSHRDVE